MCVWGGGGSVCVCVWGGGVTMLGYTGNQAEVRFMGETLLQLWVKSSAV